MNSIDLLHPELLSADTLLQILLQRRVKIEGVMSMSKEQLLDIYIKFCLPRTQRKSKNNEKGKVSVLQFDYFSQKLDENIYKSTNTFYKFNIVDDSNQDNTMECDKFSPIKCKSTGISTISTVNQTDNYDQDGMTGCKRKNLLNIETKDFFEKPAKRQRTHTS